MGHRSFGGCVGQPCRLTQASARQLGPDCVLLSPYSAKTVIRARTVIFLTLESILLFKEGIPGLLVFAPPQP